MTIAVGAALWCVGGGFAVPSAVADVVPPHAAPAYEGGVRISTTTGGFVEVRITGRGMGWSTNQHRPQFCRVQVGQEGQMIRIDALGNGFGRIGPLEHGTYAIAGRCVDQEHMTGSDLLTTGIDVVIDGEPVTAGPGGSTPKPEDRRPVTQTLNDYCNSTAESLTAVGLAGFLFTPAVGAVTTSAALGASSVMRGMCIDAARDIGDKATAVEQGCRLLEDAVYGWIENKLRDFPLQQFLPPSCVP